MPEAGTTTGSRTAKGVWRGKAGFRIVSKPMGSLGPRPIHVGLALGSLAEGGTEQGADACSQCRSSQRGSQDQGHADGLDVEAEEAAEKHAQEHKERQADRQAAVVAMKDLGGQSGHHAFRRDALEAQRL